MTVRFTGMVIPGDEIVIRHEKGAGDIVLFEVLTESGAPAISQGAAWLR